MNKEVRAQLGTIGEQRVADYLQGQGFSVLVMNYRTRSGEIDLIAQKQELLVFVEVKTRKVAYFPVASVVTYSKQQKIIKTAKYFLLSRKFFSHVIRFDVAAVLLDGGRCEIEYIENAFQG